MTKRFICNFSKVCYCCMLMTLLHKTSIAQLHMDKAWFKGTLADAGGHKLHLNVIGKGKPAVVFENGSGDFSFVWSLVQPKIAKFTKTVAYDRAGYAWSEPGPTPRTSKQICLELHTALKNAGVPPPYILVGQSFGGFLVRAFARYYPKEVVGMVLVEAVQENQRIFMGGHEPMRIRDFSKGRATPKPQLYFAPIPDTVKEQKEFTTAIDPLFDNFPDSIRQMQAWAQSQPKFIQAVQAEMDWSPEDVTDLYKHKNNDNYKLGNIPLIVLTRGKGGFNGRPDSLKLEQERFQCQKELAKLSTNSKQVVDVNSGHNIHIEDPEKVMQAIKDVFISVTTHQRLVAK